MALKNIWRTREKRLVEHPLSLTGIRRDPRDSGLVCARSSSHVQTFRTSACDASLNSFHICFWSCNSKIPFLFDLVASLLLFLLLFLFSFLHFVLFSTLNSMDTLTDWWTGVLCSGFCSDSQFTHLWPYTFTPLSFFICFLMSSQPLKENPAWTEAVQMSRWNQRQNSAFPVVPHL